MGIEEVLQGVIIGISVAVVLGIYDRSKQWFEERE
jgi:hypothetical protein